MSTCPRCQQTMPEGANQCPACGAHGRRGFFERLVGNLRPALSPAVALAAFSMTVDDVLVMPGRGAVLTGRVSAGLVRVGQPVSFQTPAGVTRVCAVQGIEKERRQVGVAQAGETVALLITGVDRDDVARGTVLVGR